MTSGYMAVLFISIGRMPILAPTLNNVDPLFALVITLAEQDPASDSLYKYESIILNKETPMRTDK